MDHFAQPIQKLELHIRFVIHHGAPNELLRYEYLEKKYKDFKPLLIVFSSFKTI